MKIASKVMTASKAGYFFDFAAVPVIVVALLWRSTNWLAMFAGAVTWQIVEYSIHRFAYHGPFRRLHAMHHAEPESLAGASSTVGTLAGFAVTWMLAVWIAGDALGSNFTAGLMVAYLAYCWIHYRLHQGDAHRFGRVMRYLAAHHGVHHALGKWNYGVSTPISDLVFRTYRR